MRQRAALILSLCLALLCRSGLRGDEPASASSDKNAAAPNVSALSGIGYSSAALPVAALGEQTYLVQPQPLVPPPPPAQPISPTSFLGAEPPMLSSFIPTFAQHTTVQRVTANLLTTHSSGPGLVVPASLSAVVHTPVAAGSLFDVADNETPRPLDRIFTTFNFFTVPTLTADAIGGVGGLANFGAPIKGSSLGPGSAKAVSLLQQLAVAYPKQYSHYVQAALTQRNFVLSSVDTTDRARLLSKAKGSNFLTPANVALLNAHSSDAQFQALVSGALVRSGVASAPIPNLSIFNRPFNSSDISQLRTDPVSVYGETFGFEKTFLDGYASIGVRMPVLQVQGTASTGIEGVGDLSVLLKFVLYNDVQTGDLISAGLVVTTPTGPSIVPASTGLSSSILDPTYLQPFVGGVYRTDNFYVQGFSSLVAPTDLRSPMLMLNNAAVGYSLYRNPESDVLTGILPSLQANWATPLGHRGLDATSVGALDTFAVSGALNFTCNRFCFTVGSSTPVTGPTPFHLGAFTQINFLF